ncbi:hypothetical protein R1flu_002161 [Riccia fluitans]|uniref:RING-type domain-containing protein n=1 Tax=Riccia fluitans TaxID=41844 RepID=A0ABD1Y5D9_9MARC
MVEKGLASEQKYEYQLDELKGDKVWIEFCRDLNSLFSPDRLEYISVDQLKFLKRAWDSHHGMNVSPPNWGAAISVVVKNLIGILSLHSISYLSPYLVHLYLHKGEMTSKPLMVVMPAGSLTEKKRKDVHEVECSSTNEFGNVRVQLEIEQRKSIKLTKELETVRAQLEDEQNNSAKLQDRLTVIEALLTSLQEAHGKVAKDLQDEKDRTLCQICLDRPRDSCSLPCFHFNYCSQCLLRHLRTSNTSPICRAPSRGTFQTPLQS